MPNHSAPIRFLIQSTTASVALIALAAATSACTPLEPRSALPETAARGGAGISITPEESERIGRRVWQNESAGRIEGLTAWNAGENFASLGIGHFIWYPSGQRGPFVESFPALLRYMNDRGAPPPDWLLTTRGCPWPTRDAFMAASNSPQMRSLRDYLAATVPLQTEFLILRLENALPQMMTAAGATQRGLIRGRFHAVASTANGKYALIDYVNFKGEGTNPNERYNDQGWGLLQVLEEMQGQPEGQEAAAEFSRAAIRVLERRVRNAPAERNEGRWMAGWRNRCLTYAQPF